MFISTFFHLLFSITSLYAAPALAGPKCKIKGVVESVTSREHQYQPESWRKSWGLSKSIEYTDIKLKVQESLLVSGGFGNGCGIEELKKRDSTFQLRSSENKDLLKSGKCIQAHTQFSGDEFAIGQWVFDVKPCE